ncbi:MAG: hypothetical protein D6743_07690 [Calditrichaeota bacterium]|nr:MAG: hypothetical protein D6743_07690 [Calditrichota bacterium]
MLKQLTLRGFDRKIERRIREIAKKEKISLNRAALRLIERGAEVSRERRDEPIGHALDEFIGTMSKEEAQALMDANKVFDSIDEDLWK